jgi:hypothetical protein
MRRSLILLASAAIIVLGLWGSAVIFLDEERLQSMVASHLSAQSGRKVEIRGALSLRFFPRLRMHAEDVVMAGPDGFDGPRFLSADELSMAVRMWPLVRGRLSPSEVRLSGATINLHTDVEGRSSVDGLVATGDGGVRRGADLLMIRQMRLEDVRVVVADMGLDRSRTIQVDTIEFEYFAFDEPLAFRFRGNLGDPAWFEFIELEGLLNVPMSRERPVRLSNMRLHGELLEGAGSLELLGHLWMSSLPVFALELADGRLEVAGQRLDVAGVYTGLERAHLRLDVAAEQLALPAGRPVDEGITEQWLALLHGVDLDANVEVGRGRWLGLNLESLGFEVTGREGEIQLDSLRGMVPGAVVSGQGRWNLDRQPADGVLELEMSIDDAAGLLAGFGIAPVLHGTGEASWTSLRLPRPSGAGQVADGRFQLWEGSWSTGEGEKIAFDRMAGRFLVSPEFVDVPELLLHLDDEELMGWMSFKLAEQTIGGRLMRVADGHEIELFGELDELAPPAGLLRDPENATRIRSDNGQ